MKRVFSFLYFAIFVSQVFASPGTIFSLNYESGELVNEYNHNFFSPIEVISDDVSTEEILLNIEIPGALLHVYEGMFFGYMWVCYTDFMFDWWGKMNPDLYMKIGGIPFFMKSYEIPPEYDDAFLEDVELLTKEFRINMFVGPDPQFDGMPRKTIKKLMKISLNLGNTMRDSYQRNFVL